MNTQLKTSFFILVAIFITLFLPPVTNAKIGVGVGTGKIVLNEELKSGTLYELPSITVINTGDSEGKYTLDITFHEKQQEIKPEKEWISFSPSEFSLEPGAAKEVQVKLALPIKTVPGDYFAYLEAQPLATSEAEGGTQIGIAAASKLYFTIAPANFFQGVWYRIISLWQTYSPIPQVIIGTIVLLLIYKLISKRISLNISIRPKKQKSVSSDDE